MFNNCKHRKGTINGICFDCGCPLHESQLKYLPEWREKLLKEDEQKLAMKISTSL